MNNKKILLFTHIDMDGMGCSILLNSIYDKSQLVTKYVNYNFEDDKINQKEFNNPEYSKIFITDLSVKKEFAVKLNNQHNITMLDHHKSSDESLTPLGYDWIHIDQSKCGTLLTYNYLLKDHPELKKYSDLVRYINDYDLWNWNYQDTLKYQILFSNLGRDNFVNRFLMNPSTVLTEDESVEVNLSINNIINEYKKIVDSAVEYIDKEGNTFLYIDLSDNIYMMSYVVYKILLSKKDTIKYVVVYTRYGSLSFRSLDYDVSKIAESLGGGGHRLASGVPVPIDKGILNIPNSIINKTWITNKLYNRKQ